MSMCRVISCVVRWGCLLWPVCSLGKTLLAFARLHSVLQGQIYLLLRCSLTSFFCIPISDDEKDCFFGVLVIEGLVDLHRTVQFQLLQHYWLGHRLGLLWYWMICLGNRDYSVIFEIASKYCISDSLFDHVGYSISSEGFLPAVVDIMVIWVKFTYSSPF